MSKGGVHTKRMHIPKAVYGVIASVALGGVWEFAKILESLRPWLLFASLLILTFSCIGWVCSQFDLISGLRDGKSGKSPMAIIIVFVIGGVISTSLWLLVKPSTQNYASSAQAKEDETNRQLQRDALLIEAGVAGKSLESIKEKLKQLSEESSKGVQGPPKKLDDAENERASKAIDAALQELPSKAITEAKKRTGVIARDVLATNMAKSWDERLRPRLNDALELMVRLITAAQQRGLVEVENISPITLPTKAVVPYLSNREYPNPTPALTVQFANNITWNIIVYLGAVETAGDQSKPPEFSGGPSFDITEKTAGRNLRILFSFDRETSEIVCPDSPANDSRKVIIASAKSKGGNFYENTIVGLLTDLRLRSSGTN